MRYHSREHRPIEGAEGKAGGGVVFHVKAGDGRTYQVRLSDRDMAEVARAHGRQFRFPFS